MEWICGDAIFGEIVRYGVSGESCRTGICSIQHTICSIQYRWDVRYVGNARKPAMVVRWLSKSLIAGTVQALLTTPDWSFEDNATRMWGKCQGGRFGHRDPHSPKSGDWIGDAQWILPERRRYDSGACDGIYTQKKCESVGLAAM